MIVAFILQGSDHIVPVAQQRSCASWTSVHKDYCMMQSKVGMQQHEHSLCGEKLLHAGKKRHEQVPCNFESVCLHEVRFSHGIFHYLFFVPFPPIAQRLSKEFASSSFICQRRSSAVS